MQVVDPLYQPPILRISIAQKMYIMGRVSISKTIDYRVVPTQLLQHKNISRYWAYYLYKLRTPENTRILTVH